MLVGNTIENWIMIIYVYSGSFGVLESNGINPKTLYKKILCLVGTMRVDYQEKVANVKMNTKWKKAKVLINLIEDYKEFALTARNCDEFFGSMAGIYWELGGGDRSEWDQRKMM